MLTLHFRAFHTLSPSVFSLVCLASQRNSWYYISTSFFCKPLFDNFFIFFTLSANFLYYSLFYLIFNAFSLLFCLFTRWIPLHMHIYVKRNLFLSFKCNFTPNYIVHLYNLDKTYLFVLYKFRKICFYRLDFSQKCVIIVYVKRYSFDI